MRWILAFLIAFTLTQSTWAEGLVVEHVMGQLRRYSYSHPMRTRALWALASMFSIAGFLWVAEAVERGALARGKLSSQLGVDSVHSG